MKRKFPSFVEAFKDLTVPIGAPVEFATWTAYWMLSAAIERRVWTFTKRRPLHPNIFAMLVAPPGIGKGLVISPARRILKSFAGDRVGAHSMTSASLVDGLKSGHRSIISNKAGKTDDYYALNVVSPEFQVLFPVYDPTFLGKVTNIYDADDYSETRRGGKGEYDFDLSKVWISMLGGTTPEQIFTTFPEGAFRTGFFSRTILVWGTPGHVPDLFGGDMDSEEVAKTEGDLGSELKAISEITGAFKFNSRAAEAIRAFDSQNYPYGGDPVPRHPRLLNYCTRRTLHIAKLMMLHALDRGETNLLLTEKDYAAAYDLLIATEDQMVEIFKEANQGGEARMVDDIRHELSIMYAKTHKPIPKSKVFAMFLERTQAFKIQAILNSAVTGGWLRQVNDKEVGIAYVPSAGTPLDEEAEFKKD